MRIIKFRAWDKIHKEMLTWSSLYDNPNLFLFNHTTGIHFYMITD